MLLITRNQTCHAITRIRSEAPLSKTKENVNDKNTIDNAEGYIHARSCK